MLWFGGRQIFANHGLAPQAFMLFVGALLTTLSPIKSLAEVNANIQQGVAAAQRVFSMLDTAPAITDRPGAGALPVLADRIRYERVSFAYEPGRPVLEDVSFELRRGEVVALVGSSGAGKSTVMDLLARFYEPTAGRITLDGVDLRDGTMASLRAQLGIVTQETILFHDTVRANIAYGLADASDESVRAAAAAAHADDFIRGLAHGYETVIGERGAEAVGRGAAAAGHRAGAAQEPAHPAARRGDLVARHGERAAGPGGARATDARPHRAGHRAPAVHRAARGPHPGAGAGPRRGVRHASGADGAGRDLPPAL